MSTGRSAADRVSDVVFRPATTPERAALLALMVAELSDRLDRTLALLGLTWAQFEVLFATRGEVRTIEVAGAAAGHAWVELRGRELHLHAIIVLAPFRGRGIGSAALRTLEAEYAGRVDVIEVGVDEGNARARAWYLRQGYRLARRLPGLGFDVLRKLQVPSGDGGSDGATEG